MIAFLIDGPVDTLPLFLGTFPFFVGSVGTDTYTFFLFCFAAGRRGTGGESGKGGKSESGNGGISGESGKGGIGLESGKGGI